MTDQRSNRACVVCHCHMNVNTKVHGLAEYAGAQPALITKLVFDGCGIIQLPCPEATHLGMSRWSMTREQYDTPAYRRHCCALLGPVVDTLVALSKDGCRLEAVYGVDGSPSCGVNETSAGFEGGLIGRGGPDAELPESHRVSGRGVYMEEFAALLAEAGLDIPFTTPPSAQPLAQS